MNWYGSIPKLLLTGGLVVLCTGCTGRKEVAIAAKDDTIRRQETLLAQEKSEKDQLADQNKALADQNNQLAEKNVAAAREQAAQTAALAAKVSEQDALLKDLGEKFARGQAVREGGEGGVHRDSNGAIHLTVAGSALFDAGRAELKPSAHALLMKVANTIKARYPHNYLRIEGHTDGTPIVHSKEKFKDNMELSLARATSVYDFLSKDGGIARAKMYTAGYGEHQPVRHPEKTAADRAANRRVEIVIMPENVKVQKDTLAQAHPAAHK
jgi:flagellar motor protein MotB